MDAWMGGDGLRELNEAVVGWRTEEKRASKRDDPEGVGSRPLRVSIGCWVDGISGQRITVGSSRQGHPIWRRSKRLQLIPSPCGTRDSAEDLCR